MKALDCTDLREKTVQELQELLDKERSALYEMRRKLVFREVKDVNSVKQQRHNIARIITLISEKKRGKEA